MMWKPDAKQHILTGNAAEHVACAALLMAGVNASITAHAAPYDIVADIGDGRVLRVEVKSKSVLTMAGTEFPLAWSRGFEFVDMVCAVMVPVGKFAFVPASMLRAGRTANIKLSSMGYMHDLHPFTARACIDFLIKGTPMSDEVYFVERDRLRPRRLTAEAIRKAQDGDSRIVSGVDTQKQETAVSGAPEREREDA